MRAKCALNAREMLAKYAFISILFTEFCSCPQKSHKSHKSQLMTKARRSLKSAALEQQEKERERTRRTHRLQLMTKARRSLKSAALEQAGKKNATLNYINAKKSHVYKFSTY